MEVDHIPRPHTPACDSGPPLKRQDLSGLNPAPAALPPPHSTSTDSMTGPDQLHPRATLPHSRGRRRRRSASAASRKPSQPTASNPVAQGLDAEYGSAPDVAVPANANDVWEPMKAALLAMCHPAQRTRPHTRQSASISTPNRRLPSGLVFSKPGLAAAGSRRKEAWVAAWLNQGEPRTALMDWVEQRSPFSPAQMPDVLQAIIRYIISQCSGHKGSVDISFRGCPAACAFDTACAGMQPAGVLPPHLSNA